MLGLGSAALVRSWLPGWGTWPAQQEGGIAVDTFSNAATCIYYYYYYYYYCIDRLIISIFPKQLKASQGWRLLKLDANGRYLNVQIIALLFPFTVHKYIYPPVCKSACWVFSCFRNPPNSDMATRESRTARHFLSYIIIIIIIIVLIGASISIVPNQLQIVYISRLVKH